MFTPDQSKALFLRVMDRMVESRWLQSHVFTDGKGHHLVWSPAGTQRAILLKAIVTGFRLNDDDRAPIGFDVIAHGDRLPDFVRPFELDPDVAGFWRESVQQLGLHGDGDGLIAFVHIIDGWAPGLDTPIVFLKD